MKAESMSLSKIISSDDGAKDHYHVPKYQREYTWGKGQWDALLQDIEENPSGYFMGSIICVQDGDISPGSEIIFEVIDGQQRLTTLSILMMALYHRIRFLKDDGPHDEEIEDDLRTTATSLRKKLLKTIDPKNAPAESVVNESGKHYLLRVQPSTQNNNMADYLTLLSEVGLLKERDRPPYFGLRAMSRAYNYFLESIPEEREEVQEFVSKVNQLDFVLITVGSQADAFTLFEALNNRGLALSAIDIIKNKMLAEMDKQHNVNIDQSFEQWQEIIDSLPDSAEHERFLRHFYNAWKFESDVRVEGVPRAVKSKIIKIYETLIKCDARNIFDMLRTQAKIYGRLVQPDGHWDKRTRQALIDLGRIGATPSYQVLLYLFSLTEDELEDEDFRAQATELLCKYYVRRNVTDFPATRDLDQAHIDLIEACRKEITNGSKLTFAFFQQKLLSIQPPDSLANFRAALEGDIYDNNTAMARYLLIKIDSTHNTREYCPDLWDRDEKGKFIWTIEHVLPQKENISKEWVEMLTGGDKAKASDIHFKNVDRLGNLTLSGYNSRLSAKPFETKQKATNQVVFGQEIKIGYRNGLALNGIEFKTGKKSSSLADSLVWNEKTIMARTEVLVNRIIELYRLPND